MDLDKLISLNTLRLFISTVTKLYESAGGDAECNLLMCMWGQCLESMNVMQVHVNE